MKPTYPLTHVYNPAFKYTPAAATNLALTFARIVAERQMQAAAAEVNVTSIKRKVSK